jgi:tRNA threonylcarbamoyl adenosine modification protein YeaZ
MKILTFDTSSEILYVTISENSEVLASKVVATNQNNYNSTYLIPTIADMLKEFNLDMQDIQAIGVNIGPGSFTGLRASVVVAKVIAQQLNIPAVGVSSMEIYSMLNKTEKPSLCLLDARRGKAYMALYSRDKNVEPQAVEYDDALEYAKNNDCVIICDKKMSEIIKNADLHCLNLSEVNENFGLLLAKLTQNYLNNGNNELYGWANLKPLYIQPPPIHSSKK